MRTLGLTAEKTMDLYYQQYKHKDDFFDLDDFIYYNSIGYAALLQDEFNKAYERSKQEEGENGVELSPEWFQEEIMEVKHNPLTNNYEAILCNRPFSFRYDKSYSAVQNIQPVTTSGCSDFIRIGAGKEWLIKRAPFTKKIFWHLLANKIIFQNVHCGLKQVRVYYIPSLATLDKNLPIAESLEDDVLRRTLDLMLKAKAGVPFIQMSADENPNGIMQTEINPDYKIKTTQTV